MSGECKNQLSGKVIDTINCNSTKVAQPIKMKINNAGFELIKHFEGLRLDAYLDAVGVPTIGYGHTDGVKLGSSITPSEAEELLRKDIEIRESWIANWAAKEGISLNENEFAACVSLAFNIGVGAFNGSTVANKLRANDRPGASNAFLLWDKGDGNVLPGLARRRQSERDLFLTKVNKMTTTANFTMRFKVSSLLKLRPVDSSQLKAGESIALSKDAILNVAAIQMDKTNGHHLITLGQVNGKQLEYLGRNTLWVFGKDAEVGRGGKLYVNNPVDSVEVIVGRKIFIPSVGNVGTETPIIPEMGGGGFLTWGMATHGGVRIPGGSHFRNILEIARRFEHDVKPVLQKHTSQPINITSWYRPEPWNSQAGGVSNSTHLSGGAIDFWVDPLSSEEVYRIFDATWVGGFGLYANGINHCDCGQNRRWVL